MNDVEKEISWIRESKKRKITEIEIELNALRDRYLTRIESQKQHLREQINIARSIDLANGISSALVTNNNSSNSGDFGNLFYDVPQYYRGYNALETELNNLMKRDIDSVKWFDYEYQLKYSNLNRMLLELESKDHYSSYLIEKLSNFDNFSAVDINLKEYYLTPLYQKLSKIFLLSLALSLVLSCSYIILRSGYKEYEKSETTN